MFLFLLNTSFCNISDWDLCEWPQKWKFKHLPVYVYWTMKTKYWIELHYIWLRFGIVFDLIITIMISPFHSYVIVPIRNAWREYAWANFIDIRHRKTCFVRDCVCNTVRGLSSAQPTTIIKWIVFSGNIFRNDAKTISEYQWVSWKKKKDINSDRCFDAFNLFLLSHRCAALHIYAISTEFQHFQELHNIFMNDIHLMKWHQSDKYREKYRNNFSSVSVNRIKLVFQLHKHGYTELSRQLCVWKMTR